MRPPQILRVGFCTLKVVSYGGIHDIINKFEINPGPSQLLKPPGGGRIGAKSGISGRGPGHDPYDTQIRTH